MTWTANTFAYGSVLTSTKMTTTQDNFTALANGDSGAPKIKTAALEQTGGSEAVTQACIRAAAVGQGELKTSLQQSLDAGGDPTMFLLTGGTYSLAWTISNSGNNYAVVTYEISGYQNYVGAMRSLGTNYCQSRYINATRPYNLGSGDIALFVYAELRPDGAVIKIDCADAPPWYYNGPHRYDPRKVIRRGGQRFMMLKEILAEHGTLEAALQAGVPRAQILDRLTTDPDVEIEITHAIKNRDRDVIPAPFQKSDPANTIVLLNPTGQLCDRLALLHESPDELTVTELFMDGHLTFDNTPIDLPNGPPGVLIVPARWKLT